MPTWDPDALTPRVTLAMHLDLDLRIVSSSVAILRDLQEMGLRDESTYEVAEWAYFILALPGQPVWLRQACILWCRADAGAAFMAACRMGTLRTVLAGLSAYQRRGGQGG